MLGRLASTRVPVGKMEHCSLLTDCLAIMLTQESALNSPSKKLCPHRIAKVADIAERNKNAHSKLDRFR